MSKSQKRKFWSTFRCVLYDIRFKLKYFYVIHLSTYFLTNPVFHANVFKLKLFFDIDKDRNVKVDPILLRWRILKI